MGMMWEIGAVLRFEVHGRLKHNSSLPIVYEQSTESLQLHIEQL